MKHDDLIRRLCEASEGSAALSAEVWTALTGVKHKADLWFAEPETGYFQSIGGRYGSFDVRPTVCITTSLSAAWEEAEMRGYRVHFMTQDLPDGRRYKAVVRQPYPPRNEGQESARTPALALCAAILAAEGER
jgi:hypothetical protein